MISQTSNPDEREEQDGGAEGTLTGPLESAEVEPYLGIGSGQPALDMRRVLALILAGGVGSRLNVLVRHRAKPAVPFGGIYRLIDFPLSNVMNCGMEKVGILTQYLPYSLTDHIGSGHAWGLVGRAREIRILPPHQGTKGSDWYGGTADAVYRNLGYLRRHQPELVVVLSGDHIYTMDFARMIDFHLRHAADATIAVRRIPIETASQFGIIDVDSQSRITGFHEKPEHPKSNLVNMGIYVFSADVLVRRLLAAGSQRANTDFGHHIFPTMLEDGDRLFAYPEQSYWQDVGTVRAYFDSHMDLIDIKRPLNLKAWRVRTNLEEARLGDRPPAFVGRRGHVRQSVICRGCRIDGNVSESILSPGVLVEEGAVVRQSIILHDVRVRAGARIEHAIVDKSADIGPEAVIGGWGSDQVNERFPKHLDSGITLVGKGAHIPERVRIGKNVVVLSEQKLPLSPGAVVESGGTVGDAEA